MCCVCNGSCNHVGPHSYCSAHGGSPSIPAVYAFPAQNTMFPMTPAPCDHCWCRRADPETDGAFPMHAEGPHRQCCKCHTYMAEEFLAPVEDGR